MTSLCGVALMLRPGEGGEVMTILLGVSLLAEGILNLSTVLTAVKIVKNQRPDVIDAEEYYEERKD